MTPYEQRALETLKAALPPMYTKHEDVLARVCAPFGLVCVDLEWEPESGALTTIGIGNESWVGQWDWPTMDDFQRLEARNALVEMMQAHPVVYHNAVSDLKKLRQNGFKISAGDHAQLDDTMLAHAVLDSELEHTLEFLCLEHGKLPAHKWARTLAPAEYNAGDLVETVLIWKHALLPRLLADPAAYSVYKYMSLPFIDIVIEGEEAGIRVAPGVAEALKTKYETKLEQATRLAQAYCGWPVNPGSPDQVKVVLYNVDGLPIQRERAGWGEQQGKATSDKDAIATLRRLQGTEWDAEVQPTLASAWANIEAGGHPFLEARYLYMGAKQALSHYVQPCLGVERIWPECRMHVQTSGRHSYVGPALSQFTGSKTPDTAQLVTPDVGTCWVGHDWSNVETWLLGGLANDPLILEAKQGGWDTHTLNFCDSTGTPYPTHLTKALHTCSCDGCVSWRAKLKWLGADDLRRDFFKRFVYRLHYRGKAENCGDIPGAASLGFNVDRLTSAAESYLGKHPAVVAFWSEIEAQADAARCVYTFMGRPRRLTSEFRNARNREASNHPLQGGVSDIYITTALRVKRAAPWARLVFGAFDSMWWQIPVGRKLEFSLLYAPIVERVFDVNGRAMSFPAAFKVKEAA